MAVSYLSEFVLYIQRKLDVCKTRILIFRLILF